MHHNKPTLLVGHNGGPPLDELVDEARACAIIGGQESPIHRSTLWRGIRDGRYPKPIKVSKRASRWIMGELRAVTDRAASDRATAA